MTNPTLLLAISFIGVTVFLIYRLVYWQQRNDGRSHAASFNESAVFSLFLLCSAAVDYVAVVANYS